MPDWFNRKTARRESVLAWRAQLAVATRAPGLGMAVADHGITLVVGSDPQYVRRANVVAQLGYARPGLRVHSTLAETIEACRAPFSDEVVRASQ
ncbi:hypothetical protein ACFWDI_26120 [Streptomyces sp. NPDC060064]|uniref:hypothetical protein n=1 Tax=Streptomyces sp. NPDC060064 TaxID=3347049 RepID=UPI00369CBF09